MTRCEKHPVDAGAWGIANAFFSGAAKRIGLAVLAGTCDHSSTFKPTRCARRLRQNLAFEESRPGLRAVSGAAQSDRPVEAWDTDASGVRIAPQGVMTLMSMRQVVRLVCTKIQWLAADLAAICGPTFGPHEGPHESCSVATCRKSPSH